MPPLEPPPPSGGIGRLRRSVPQKKYSPTSKFLRMSLSEEARLIGMDERAQGMYAGKAAFESVRLIQSSTQYPDNDRDLRPRHASQGLA